MATWKRKPQEREGNHLFSGKVCITERVQQEIPDEEIKAICHDLGAFIAEKTRIDYMQVYTDEDSRTLYFVDNLSEDMLNSIFYQGEENYSLLMFAEEYAS
jgi:hypothetical protein